jgi:hypothetical protein
MHTLLKFGVFIILIPEYHTSLESKSLRFGKKDPMVMACSEKMFPWEIIGVMVQMMEVRFGIRKTLFLGQLTLKKWLIR